MTVKKYQVILETNYWTIKELLGHHQEKTRKIENAGKPFCLQKFYKAKSASSRGLWKGVNKEERM